MMQSLKFSMQSAKRCYYPCSRRGQSDSNGWSSIKESTTMSSNTIGKIHIRSRAKTPGYGLMYFHMLTLFVVNISHYPQRYYTWRGTPCIIHVRGNTANLSMNVYIFSICTLREVEVFVNPSRINEIEIQYIFTKFGSRHDGWLFVPTQANFDLIRQRSNWKSNPNEI
jgi:hypothetical protein